MRQRYWFRDGDVRDADGMPLLNQFEAQAPLCAPMVMRDTPDYQSPIDGRWITSRSWRREDLKRNNCVEVDPPRKPRGFKNERFARKRALPLNPEISKDPNAAERHNARLHDSKRRTSR
jgi:hypothetical protein